LTDNGLEVAEGDGDNEEKYENRGRLYGDDHDDEVDYDDDYDEDSSDDEDDLEEYLFQVS